MFAKLFLHHPHTVDETYIEHFRFALWFSAKLFMAAGAALIHALVPACCEKTASSIIAELYQRTQNRG